MIVEMPRNYISRDISYSQSTAYFGSETNSLKAGIDRKCNSLSTQEYFGPSSAFCFEISRLNPLLPDSSPMAPILFIPYRLESKSNKHILPEEVSHPYPLVASKERFHQMTLYLHLIFMLKISEFLPVHTLSQTNK